MTRRWWLGILLLHLGFFGAWAGLEEFRRRGAPEFLLETEGVDPRDLWSGQYLELAYPAARLDGRSLEQSPRDGAAMAVKLEPAGDTRVAGQAWPLWRAVSKLPAKDGDYSAFPSREGWARGQAQGGRVLLGIERYYFEEDREAELRKLVPGRYFALVSLSPDGRLRLKRLIW